MSRLAQSMTAIAVSLWATAAQAGPPVGAVLPGGNQLTAAVVLAQRATTLQAWQLGVTVSSPTATPALPPSAMVLALAARHGVVPDDEQVRAARQLDHLPDRVRAALADVIDAYVAFDIATRLLPVPSRLATGSPTTQQIEPGRIALGSLLWARSHMLDAIVALHEAVSAGGNEDSPAPLSLCPAVALDLTGTSDTYTADCALIVDVGGNDTYLNNAGGSNILGVVPPNCGLAITGAGALIDLNGQDRYISGHHCGINGGASGGAGFLLDVAGDDIYSAGGGGINGGGNGGYGFLLDVAGTDSYSAGTFSTNGGGGWNGAGLLLDTGGNDSYGADGWGSNGGAHDRGIGLLLDTEGTDSYTATSVGANGGAHDATTGTGLLLDGGGQGDTYSDLEGGTGTDKTVAPKGSVGMQLDVVPQFSPATPSWVERTLLQQSVPVVTPPVPAIDADLLRVKGNRSSADPRNYEISLWIAGQLAPTNPISVFTGGLLAVPVDLSLLHTPPIASQSAELRLTVRHRYDPAEVVCLIGVGDTCVNAPLDPLDIPWLTTAGPGAELIVDASLFVNGQQIATQTVAVPLLGQLFAVIP